MKCYNILTCYSLTLSNALTIFSSLIVRREYPYRLQHIWTHTWSVLLSWFSRLLWSGPQIQQHMDCGRNLAYQSLCDKDLWKLQLVNSTIKVAFGVKHEIETWSGAHHQWSRNFYNSSLLQSHSIFTVHCFPSLSFPLHINFYTTGLEVGIL